MPFLILNMGGEMIYILEQRLNAQQISAEKSRKVLQDVLCSMLRADLQIELFQAQPLYSSRAVREVFTRLAHSSIMKLNDSSMDKLFDLMSMGCKYSIMQVEHPLDLLSITLNHFDHMRKTASGHAQCEKLVRAAYDATIQLYSSLCSSVSGKQSLYVLRQTLLLFFLDKQVKVSLFLQDGLQSSEGAILCNSAGQLTRARHTPQDVFGSVTIYPLQCHAAADAQTHVLALANAAGVTQASHSIQCYDVREIVTGLRQSSLGGNLYAKERSKKPGGSGGSSGSSGSRSSISVPSGTSLAAAHHHSTQSTGSISGAAGLTSPNSPLTDASSSKAAKADLNSLASLIGFGSAITSPGKQDVFHLCLFPGDDDEDAMHHSTSHDSNEDSKDWITFDNATTQSQHQALTDSLNEDKAPPQPGAAASTQQDDDLLAMMDGAS